MDFAAFSSEQLYLFQCTLDGIMRQLEDIAPHLFPEEDKKLYETMSQQAYVLHEQITLEIVRRSLTCLQAQIEVKDTPHES